MADRDDHERRLRELREEAERAARERARLEARLEELDSRRKELEREAKKAGVEVGKDGDLEAALRRAIDERRAEAERLFDEAERALGVAR